MIYVLNAKDHDGVYAVVEGPRMDLHADIAQWILGVCPPRPVLTEHQGKNTPGYQKQLRKLEEWHKMKKEKANLGLYLARLKNLGFKILNYIEVDSILLEK